MLQLLCIAMQVDLNDPTSIPAALVGISTIVDCATARPEESAQKIDWDGKVALIQSAQVSLPSCQSSLQGCTHCAYESFLCNKSSMACCRLCCAHMCACGHSVFGPYDHCLHRQAQACCGETRAALWYCRQWAFSGTCSFPFTTATSTLKFLSCK